MKKLFIWLFNQLETGARENIDSFFGGLRAAHGTADLPVTNEELYFRFSVLLYEHYYMLYEHCYMNYFMNNFLIKIITIAYYISE